MRVCFCSRLFALQQMTLRRTVSLCLCHTACSCQALRCDHLAVSMQYYWLTSVQSLQEQPDARSATSRCAVRSTPKFRTGICRDGRLAVSGRQLTQSRACLSQRLGSQSGKCRDESYCSLLDVQRLVHVRNDLGNLLKSKGLLPEAKVCYEECLRQEPTMAVAWNNIGCINLEENNLQLAVHHFSKAAYFDPYLECTYKNLVR